LSVRFEADCKVMANEQAAAAGHLRRGHLVVDNELLLEHWWVSNGEKIIDPALVDVRGRPRSSKSVTLEYLPIDPEGTLFDAGSWTECMQTWGDCSLHEPCDWCAARQIVIQRAPNVRPGHLMIGFGPPTAWDRLTSDDDF